MISRRMSFASINAWPASTLASNDIGISQSTVLCCSRKCRTCSAVGMSKLPMKAFKVIGFGHETNAPSAALNSRRGRFSITSVDASDVFCHLQCLVVPCERFIVFLRPIPVLVSADEPHLLRSTVGYDQHGADGNADKQRRRHVDRQRHRDRRCEQRRCRERSRHLWCEHQRGCELYDPRQLRAYLDR